MQPAPVAAIVFALANSIKLFGLTDGQLLKGELAASLEGLERRYPKAIYAAAQFETSKTGKVRLELTGISGAPAWIDGKAVQFKSPIELELSQGTHSLIIKIKTSDLPDSIRLGSPDATFLTQDQQR